MVRVQDEFLEDAGLYLSDRVPRDGVDEVESQSPIIYEVLDFGVGITDSRGELVSQGNGIAGFLGPLGEAVQETLARQAAGTITPLRPGDVIIANDPYAGGGTHLSDVVLVRPVFWEQQLIGFAAAKGHWTEIGGKDPGSWTADSADVYAEGLQLPFVHAYRAGQPGARGTRRSWPPTAACRT